MGFLGDQDSPVRSKVVEVSGNTIAENPNVVIVAIRCNLFGIS